MPANAANERGYWESSAVMVFNDRLLESAGSAWDDWRAFNPDWYRSAAAASLKPQAADLLQAEFGSGNLIILKDPRICRFAPFWLEVLGELGHPPAAVIPFRSPLEVAISLKRRDGFPLTKGALLWLRHILEAEAASRHIPRVIFPWNSFLDDWHHTAHDIAEKAGIVWPRVSDRTAQEIDNYLSKDLRHEMISDSRLEGHPDLDDWVRLAYEAMLTLAEQPDSEPALRSLDEIRAGFERACSLFGRVVLDLETEQEHRLQLAHQDAAERAELIAAHEREIAVHEREIENFTAQIRTALPANSGSDARISPAEMPREGHLRELFDAWEVAQEHRNSLQRDLESAIKDLETERSRTEHLSQINERLSKLYQSTSWRVTSPLRMMQRIRRGEWREVRHLIGRKLAPWLTRRC
jgi:hypothetical protein